MSLAALVLAVATAASAAETPPRSDAPLKAAFAGTIVSTYPDGRTALLWLEPGGAYSGLGRRRTPSSGTWSIKGEQICLKQRRPFFSPLSYCTPIPQGLKWTAKAVTGEPIALTITAGGREQAPGPSAR